MNEIQLKQLKEDLIFPFSMKTSFRDFTIAEADKCEERVIKKVVEEFLEREMTVKDLKKIVRMFVLGVPDTYELLYDIYLLGTVSYCYDNGFSVKFNPNNDLVK